MPLFHVHTFLALSAVLVCLFVFGDAAMRKHIAWLIGLAFIPATFLVFLITDYFHAGSVFAFQPGWVESDGEFAAPIPLFWLKNFGLWIPVVLTAVGLCFWRFSNISWRLGQKVSEDVAFLIPAVGIFLFAFFIKTAPWGWDNLKLMVWAYFLILPLIWHLLIKHWAPPARFLILIALFGSGFISLFGGLAAGRPGFGFADRDEVDGVGHAIENLPVAARFAAFPTFNHPLLLQGRDLVLGYPGHLWTEGYDYTPVQQQLTELMNGDPKWQEIARKLNVRYIFWGREETTNYPSSKRPWENRLRRVAKGDWGAIYEVPPTNH